MFAFVFISLGYLSGYLTTIVGKRWLLVGFAAGRRRVNIVLNIILIPPYGAVGSAWATVFTEAAVNGLALWAVFKALQFRPAVGRAARTVVAAALMTGAVAPARADRPGRGAAGRGTGLPRCPDRSAGAHDRGDSCDRRSRARPARVCLNVECGSSSSPANYPPAVTGGYERECAAAVGHLRRDHEVVVLTSRRSRRLSPAEPNLRRVLPVLPGGWRGSLMAPAVARRAATLVEATIEDTRPGSDLLLERRATAPRRDGRRIPQRRADRLPRLRALVRRDAQPLRPVRPPSRARRSWLALRLGTAHPADQPRPPTCASIAPRRIRDDRLEQPVPEDGHRVPADVAPLFEEVIYPARRRAIGSPVWSTGEPSARPTILSSDGSPWRRGSTSPTGPWRAAIPRSATDALPWSLQDPDEGACNRTRSTRPSALDVGRHVDLRGELGQDGIAALLGRPTRSSIPSIWQEPAGLVCVEAALARVPIVASRSGGIAELVRDRRDGLLFSLGDAEQCGLLAETLADPRATAGPECLRARPQSPFNRMWRPPTAFSSERCGHSGARPDRSGEATSRADRRNAHPTGGRSPSGTSDGRTGSDGQHLRWAGEECSLQHACGWGAQQGHGRRSWQFAPTGPRPDPGEVAVASRGRRQAPTTAALPPKPDRADEIDRNRRHDPDHGRRPRCDGRLSGR